MFGGWLYRRRRQLGLVVLVALVGWVAWNEKPWHRPVAHEPQTDPLVWRTGLDLFQHEWKVGDELAQGDGLGPVFNDRSCVSCHSQGGVGGGGGIEHNVTTFEAHPVPGRPEVQSGIIHAFSISSDCQESRVGLNDFFQVVPGGLTIKGTCFLQVHDFDPVQTDSINSTALFGAGWVDQIPEKSIINLSRARAMTALGQVICGNLRGVKAGRPRSLPDGRVGKFGWKAQFATLEEFVAAACANEIGLGNPLMAQARPYAHNASMTVKPDLDKPHFESLVSFVSTIPRPIEVLPTDPNERAMAERGRTLFDKVGCTICHVPSLGGVEGVYSDFLLHRLSNPDASEGYEKIPQVQLPSEHPLPDEWKTPALWGVADSAPYFHDGQSPTLHDAIVRHDGDARTVTSAFNELTETDQQALISFLKTLKAPAQPVKPASSKSSGLYAMAH